MTTWTVTPGVVPTGQTDQFVEVDSEDPYDTRYFANSLTALNFLIGQRMKMGDVLQMGATPSGNVMNVVAVKIGDLFEYDVGAQQISCPEDLIGYLNANLQIGDTVHYLPYLAAEADIPQGS